jgi:glucosamine--fructose-6-phosphate aminotransferase (isomerizing)
MAADQPGLLVGARHECPLVVGEGEDEQFIASAIPAFLRQTRRVKLVNDDEIVVVRPYGTEFLDRDGNLLEREAQEVDWDEDAAEKGGYETFMLKEIHEQADAVADTVVDRLAGDAIDLGELGLSDDDLRDMKSITIVACGTSYHAGLVGRYAIEEWARVPVQMDIASEYRYRNPVVGEGDLVIGITQSGETLDTLAAMRLARERGAKVIALTNVMGSQATRDAHGVLFTRAGIEIGVAATKTFVAQVAAMYLLGLKLAQLRGTLSPERISELSDEMRRIPHLMTELLPAIDERVTQIAEHWQDSNFFLYLGRHIGLPVCLEGALKLKEISYIPTDAYAAGEMKHGPIALLDDRTPVVCVATDAPVLDKILSNMAEVRVRGAHVIAIATEGQTEVESEAEEVVYVPRTDWLLQPILAVIPLQLLAYRIARARGLNVDQPRNLAKTVTVE